MADLRAFWSPAQRSKCENRDCARSIGAIVSPPWGLYFTCTWKVIASIPCCRIRISYLGRCKCITTHLAPLNAVRWSPLRNKPHTPLMYCPVYTPRTAHKETSRSVSYFTFVFVPFRDHTSFLSVVTVLSNLWRVGKTYSWWLRYIMCIFSLYIPQMIRFSLTKPGSNGQWDQS